MPRPDSPASSLRSQEAGAAPKQPSGPPQKAAYRLFPAVEPTPPASPVSLQRVTLNRAESVRRRSSSLDNAARLSANQPHYGLRQLHAAVTRKGRKMSVTDLKPMSTVQEQPLDSPTVPSRFTFKSVTNSVVSEDSYHGRSSSAPSEFARDSPVEDAEQEPLKGAPPVWMNRQAAASTQTLHGLGLTIPPTTAEEQTPAPAKRHTRTKPNLRLNIRGSKQEQPDRPPPPPPKSPRHHARNESAHSRTESAHSRTSSAASHFSSRASSRASTRGSPIEVAQSMAYRAVTVKPTFATQSSQSRESSRAREGPMVKQLLNAETRLQDETSSPVITKRGRTRKPLFRKPVPPPPSKDATEKELHTLARPASKFSLPTEEPSTEGERTPRAVGVLSDVPNVKPEAEKFSSQGAHLQPPASNDDDLPPPTPLKDTFHLKKSSDDSSKSHKNTPPTPLKDSHFTPPKPAEAKKYDSARQHQTAPAEEVSKPQPPKREAPPRPDSPPTQTTEPRSLAPSSNARTSEMLSRAPTPEPKLKPSRGRPTPELPFRSATPDLTPTTPVGPMETLRNLSKQTEALHARYASLRSDRQKLSTSIVSSLKDQKAGPEYVNTLLDQHLSLAAINSSMDICFAKLKSLECRKEEAMNAIIAKEAAKRKMDKVKKPTSVRSASSLRDAERSGRSTPDLVVEVAKTQRSASNLRKDSARSNSEKAKIEGADDVEAASERKDSTGSTDFSEKRNTMIRSPPAELAEKEQLTTEEPDALSSGDVEEERPKKFRVKGAKAARILGLMKEATERPGSPGITLPDELKLVRTLTPPCAYDIGKAGPVIELHIPTSPLKLGLPPPSPAPTTPLPTPPSASGTPPALPARKDTIESSVSVASSTPTVSTIATTDDKSETPSRAGSSAESSAPETPSEEKDKVPLGLKTAPKGLLQTIEIHVDDEILDYYHSAGNKSARQSPAKK